jgi:hypothetical protein
MAFSRAMANLTRIFFKIPLLSDLLRLRALLSSVVKNSALRIPHFFHSRLQKPQKKLTPRPQAAKISP